MNPKKILVSGDWHCFFRAAQASAREAARLGCDTIFQVGDFGYWPHTNPEYLTQVNSAMKKKNLNVVWVDGNHENFHALYDGDWEKTEEGFWKLADRVFYAPRALRWEWSGVKFLALGGGHSIDKDWRLSQGPIGLYWWPEETITQKNVYDCLNGGGEVDVMFTHDMPHGTRLGMKLFHNSPPDEQNRMAVRTVVEAVKPKHLFHGHYHHRSDSLLELDGHTTAIHSLDMWNEGWDERNKGMWKVLTLSEDGAYAPHDPSS